MSDALANIDLGELIAGLNAGGPGSGCNPEVGRCGRPRTKDAYQKTKEEFTGPYPEMPKSGWSDADSERWDAWRDKERDWDSSVNEAVSEGRLSVHDAAARGWKGGDDKVTDWKPLPGDLYHVTMAKSAVEDNGLKTRDELGSGGGLGGGQSNTVSFTTNPEYAKVIRDTFLEAREVAQGEISTQDLVSMAKSGEGAKRPFYDDILKHIAGNNPEKEVQRIADGIVMERPGLPRSVSEMPGWTPVPESKWPHGDDNYMEWERKLPPHEALDRKFDFYKAFLAYRENAGGPENPLFFTNEPEKLAAAKESDIAILHYQPVSGAMGIQHNAAESEWRTYSGKAVKLVGISASAHELDSLDLDELAAILAYGTSDGAVKGWETRRGGEPGPSEALVSPNQREGTTIGDARTALASEDHAKFVERATEVANTVAHGATVRSAIGSWKDGAENTVVVTGTMTLDDTRYVAAKLGLEKNQKGVIAFHEQKGGKDSLWTLGIGSDYTEEQIIGTLGRHGLEFSTLIQRDGGGTDVHVYDPGQTLQTKIVEVANEYETNARKRQGHGEYIGGDTREEGAAAQRAVVEAYERKKGIRASDNRRDGGRSRDSDLLGADATEDLAAALEDLLAYGTSEGVMKEWDERGRGRKAAPEGLTDDQEKIVQDVEKAYQDEVAKNHERDVAVLKGLVLGLCHGNGIGYERVNFVDEARPFTVGNKQFNEAANANLETGQLTFRVNEILSHSLGVIAPTVHGIAMHEIEHLKFNSAMMAYFEEKGRLRGLEDKVYREKTLGHPDMTPMDAFNSPEYPTQVSGALKDEFKSQFPLTARFEPTEGMHFMEMVNEDGVSDYSKAYWDAAKTGNVSTMQAFHETVAEIARLKATDPNTYATKVTPLWKAYVKAVDKTAAERKF